MQLFIPGEKTDKINVFSNGYQQPHNIGEENNSFVKYYTTKTKKKKDLYEQISSMMLTKCNTRPQQR